MRGRSAIAALLALLMVAATSFSAGAADAPARERIAVLILPVQPDDQSLADNLTEVAIGRLAEGFQYDLVGTRELRRKLEQGGAAELPIDCLSQNACLGRVGTMVGVRRLVSGSVRRDHGEFLLALALNDMESGLVQRTFFRAVTGQLDSLIEAVQAGVNDLFQRAPAAGQLRVDSEPDGATVLVDERVRGTTPVWINPLEPGNHRLRVEIPGRFPWKQDLTVAPGQSLLVAVRQDQMTARRTWAPYVAYGAAMGAALSLGTAALFGTLSHGDLTGQSRHEVEQDLEVKRGYATIANVSLAVGIALACASAFTFVRFQRDIAER